MNAEQLALTFERNKQEILRLREQAEEHKKHARQWLYSFVENPANAKALTEDCAASSASAWVDILRLFATCPDSKVSALSNQPDFMKALFRALESTLKSGSPQLYACSESVSTVICQVLNHAHASKDDHSWLRKFLAEHPLVLATALVPHASRNPEAIKLMQAITVSVIEAKWLLEQKIFVQLLECENTAANGFSTDVLVCFADLIERMLVYPDTEYFSSENSAMLPKVDIDPKIINALLSISVENAENATAAFRLLFWLLCLNREASRQKPEGFEDAVNSPKDLANIAKQVAEKVIREKIINRSTQPRLIGAIIDVMIEVVKTNISNEDKASIAAAYLPTCLESLNKEKNPEEESPNKEKSSPHDWRGSDFINSRFLKLFEHIFGSDQQILEILLSKGLLQSLEDTLAPNALKPKQPTHLNSFVRLLLCSQNLLPAVKQLQLSFPPTIKSMIKPILTQNKAQIEAENRLRGLRPRDGAVSVSNMDGMSF